MVVKKATKKVTKRLSGDSVLVKPIEAKKKAAKKSGEKVAKKAAKKVGAKLSGKSMAAQANIRNSSTGMFVTSTRPPPPIKGRKA